MDNNRKDALETSAHWWFCENIVSHKGQIGLLRMDFPRAFILLRDYDKAYFASFEDFCHNIAEVNFFDPEERDDIAKDAILTEAWNFLALSEEEEENMAELNNYYKNEEDYD